MSWFKRNLLPGSLSYFLPACVFIFGCHFQGRVRELRIKIKNEFRDLQTNEESSTKFKDLYPWYPYAKT